MLTKEEFVNVTKQYKLTETGHYREHYNKKLIPALKRKEILILKGIRRCGKTTILKQLIKHLQEKEQIKKENILYVNFDDFNFTPHLSIELLELMLSTRNLKEKQFIFLDEIQKVPLFENWLRTQYDREIQAKFIISGSNATLLAKDLATLLTGRNLSYEIFPLSYKEYKEFNKEKNMAEYLTYGGFPEVVLEKDTDQKLNILRNYLSDIINKDILQRRNVRDQQQLLTFIQYILKNPGAKLSINKLAKLTDTSKETVSKYLEYLVEAYIIIEVPYFSYSAKTKFNKTQNPKYYVLDNGFYTVNSPRAEIGKQYENIIASNLFTKNKEIYYWSEEESETDFITEDRAINVTATKNIPQREEKGLQDIKAKYPALKKFLLINQEINQIDDSIEYVDIETFLLQ